MFQNIHLKVVSYGEVLFDVFGEEKKIGGAPLNLALRVKSFGFPVSMISAVGDDENGKILLDYINKNNVSTDAISVLNGQETGVVQVTLNERGSATYEIKFPSAWDYIELDETKEKIVKEADVFFYGSLACRNENSRNTLFRLLESNDKMYKIFDVNLRAPHYTTEVLLQLMMKADFIKFNDEEILEIASSLGFSSDSLEANIRFIAEKIGEKPISVTQGKHGSILFWKGEIYNHDGYVVKVADTVGAGDSFLASLVAQLLSHGNPVEALDFASAVGAIVASYQGANPVISEEEVENFRKK